MVVRREASEPISPLCVRWKQSSVTVLFGITLFLSSALLFILEPMFARMVLPKLGGTPAVWNVCLVFYQSLLLGGYAYAHALAKQFAPRRAAVPHLAAILVALLVLPIHLPKVFNPFLAGSPILWLLILLVMGVGLPFFVLTTYSSTLQTWYANTSRVSAHEPYVLYSAGNLGSLFGLLAYPALIERHLGLSEQSRWWELGYLLLLGLTVCCAITLWQEPAQQSEARPEVAPFQVTRRQEMKWLALAFIPSSLMLGITTALTTELPPIPLLWILPLSVYLLSFVMVFGRNPIAYHGWVVERLPIFLVVAGFLLASRIVPSPIFSIPFYLVVLFLACLACHGELAITRPPPGGLTHFYLTLAIGGALGGAFNALIAPAIFRSVIELPLALFLLALARAFTGTRRHRQLANVQDFILPLGLGASVAAVFIWANSSQLVTSRVILFALFIVPVLVCLSFAGRPLRFALGFGALVVAGVVFFRPIGEHVRLTERSFFGVYRISDYGDYRQLSHGNTIHGIQSLDPKRALKPLAYYYETGPIGQVFSTPSVSKDLREVAVIGLGAGSLACYRSPRRHFTFYEIDPVVETIARNSQYFTFMRDCLPEAMVVIGDARVSLQSAPPHKYDLLVADAFSSDSIPVHLITKEAIQLYLTRLAAHGLLAFNISNRYLDLRPVLAAIARDAGLQCLIRNDTKLTGNEQHLGKSPSIWVLMARTRADFATLASDPEWQEFPKPEAFPVWTDDYSTLAGIIHWSGT